MYMCLREAWRIAFCIVNHLLDSRTCKDLDQGKKSTSLRIRLKKKKSSILTSLCYCVSEISAGTLLPEVFRIAKKS